jgi:hypothetical protein
MTTDEIRATPDGGKIYLRFYDIYAEVIHKNRLGVWVLPEQSNEWYGIVAGKDFFVRNNNLY